MNNFTINTYEMKREIEKFSKKVTENLDKVSKKFTMDMQYGMSKSKSCLISEISRALDEKINLKNTIERLCDNLVRLTDAQRHTIKNNYCLWRFMIDAQYQGKGYAPQILDEVMKLVRTYPYGPAEYIWLSYEPENTHGKNVYMKYGFRENGEMCDDEIMAIYKL